MLVEHKAIIKRLTKTCVAALESGVVAAMNARHYDVTVEHILSALFENADSDVAFLAMHYDLDVTGLKTTLTRSLEGLRAGNAGKPTFSPSLMELYQDAFTVAYTDLERFELNSERHNLRIKPRGGRNYNFTTDRADRADVLSAFHAEVRRARTRVVAQDQ